MTELEYTKKLLKKLRDSCVEVWQEASFVDVRSEIDHYFLGIPDEHFVVPEVNTPQDQTIALAVENALIFIDEAKGAGNVHAPGIVKLLLRAKKILATRSPQATPK